MGRVMFDRFIMFGIIKKFICVLILNTLFIYANKEDWLSGDFTQYVQDDLVIQVNEEWIDRLDQMDLLNAIPEDSEKYLLRNDALYHQEGSSTIFAPKNQDHTPYIDNTHYNLKKDLEYENFVNLYNSSLYSNKTLFLGSIARKVDFNLLKMHFKKWELLDSINQFSGEDIFGPFHQESFVVKAEAKWNVNSSLSLLGSAAPGKKLSQPDDIEIILKNPIQWYGGVQYKKEKYTILAGLEYLKDSDKISTNINAFNRDKYRISGEAKFSLLPGIHFSAAGKISPIKKTDFEDKYNYQFSSKIALDRIKGWSLQARLDSTFELVPYSTSIGNQEFLASLIAKSELTDKIHIFMGVQSIYHGEKQLFPISIKNLLDEYQGAVQIIFYF